MPLSFLPGTCHPASASHHLCHMSLIIFAIHLCLSLCEKQSTIAMLEASCKPLNQQHPLNAQHAECLVCACSSFAKQHTLVKSLSKCKSPWSKQCWLVMCHGHVTVKVCVTCTGQIAFQPLAAAHCRLPLLYTKV